jgi:glycogen operon protein
MMIEEPGLLRTIEEWEKIEGAPAPLGVTWIEAQQAYNFALFSRYATGVTLLFYIEQDPTTPIYQYRFNPLINKTGRIWHCWVPVTELRGATLYGYRVEGPFDPAAGHRFDPQKILLDPYANGVYFPPNFSRMATAHPGPTDGVAPLGVLPRQHDPFDWGPDPRPRHTHDMIVYELHVKGFTARPNAGVSSEKRGTFAGLIEKIPYLQELGVTVVELLPVHQYDPQEGNYWGYMTLNFFSPHHNYASGDPLDEFREMVKAFHAVGIEVWLDVVYNHTSEGNESGPTYSFRGIDNYNYYLLAPDRQSYLNDTGCGNTIRCAHPAVRALVVESLRYWAEQMHVDGFRFDLASIFTRNIDGSVNLEDPPVVAEISTFGYRADVRLVAEAWDIATFQLGRSFPGLAWRQWNGKFRDDIRSFVKGDPGQVSALMQRLYGSDDLFPGTLYEAYRPFQSVNFITTHDGFCLYDLVAYNHKHNETNGQHNADGNNNNLSWNCGWEGDVGAPAEVLALRRRQVKNFFCLLMLANGTPMFCAGDEFMNTQCGNNNPYNQDNEITWLDWELLERNRDVFRFFKLLIAFRKAHRSIGRSHYWREDVRWYGVGPHVDLSYPSHTLAYYLHGASQRDSDIYVMINAYWEDLLFTVQEGQPGEWQRVVDTSLPSPQDIAEPGQEIRLDSLQYRVVARSIVVLYRQDPRNS